MDIKLTWRNLLPPKVCLKMNMNYVSSLRSLWRYVAFILSWTANNNMQINTSKTNEMFLGRLLNPANFPHLSTPTGSVERVTWFKPLGINLEAKLSWSPHINTMSDKASKHHCHCHIVVTFHCYCDVKQTREFRILSVLIITDVLLWKQKQKKSKMIMKIKPK